MEQLKMIIFERGRENCKLPRGFVFENYTESSENACRWAAIIASDTPFSGTPEAFFDSVIRKRPGLVPERDLFFITDSSGRAVATSAAVTNPDGTGYVHMFWSVPEARGKGLGKPLLTETLDRLASRGSFPATLTTDDFRLPAIKTYLRFGFVPVISPEPENDYENRWRAIFEKLGVAPGTVKTVYTK